MDEISSKIPSNLGTGKAITGQTTDPEREKKLKKACVDFEAMLVFQLLKNMRQSVPKDGFLKSSQSKEMYEMMLDQKIADNLANKGEGLGLQKVLYNQITQHYFKK